MAQDVETENAALDLLRAARIAERLCEENCSEPDPPPLERREDAAFAAVEVRKRAEVLADKIGG